MELVNHGVQVHKRKFTARSANVQELLISRIQRVQERAARPAVLSSGASGNDATFLETGIAISSRSWRANDDVIANLAAQEPFRSPRASAVPRANEERRRRSGHSAATIPPKSDRIPSAGGAPA